MSEALQPKSSDIEESVKKAVGKKSMRWGLESPDELIGTRIDDRYTIVERIARGGMGTVFKAIQAPMGRVCAVKVLSASYEGKKDPAFDKRFRREAATISRLVHPSTVTLYDYGNIGDLYYMAMEYVQGRTLHAEIFHEGRFEERRAIRIAMQICRSLREAHSHGVVHRDLKPDNVLLVDRANEKDLVKVLDFGLAKVLEGDLAEEDVTETGLCMGSPKHMAPEQITGDTVSAHTDVYALGVLLYEMLTAHSPFDRPTRYQTLVAQVHEPPMPFGELLPDAEISEGMERIVMKCLHKERHHRFASMDDVLLALKTLERGSRASMSSMPSMSGVTSVPFEGGGRPVSAGSATAAGDRGARHSVFPPPSGPSAAPGKGTASSVPGPQALPPLPPLPNVPHPASRKLNLPVLVGGAVGALGLVAALGAWLSLPGDAAVTRAHPSLAGIASAGGPSVTASARVPSPNAGSTDVVAVDSEPAGAKVYAREALLCEATPCEVTWTEALGDGPRELRVELPGFAPATHVVEEGETSVSVKLVALRGGRPSALPQPGGEELAEDTGYKYSPY